MCVFLYSGSVKWLKYESKNCYDWNGADNIAPNPYSSALSLTDCQAACETDGACEGILVEKGKEASGRCFKRRNIQPADCIPNNNLDLFILSRGMKEKLDHTIINSPAAFLF